jgi:hypothetical protein
LTFDLSGVAAADYPAVCRAITEAFDLVPAGELIIGPEQLFWDFRRGEQVVGLEWDIWSEFMVVAKSPVSEPLVREIAARLQMGQSPSRAEVV